MPGAFPGPQFAPGGHPASRLIRAGGTYAYPLLEGNTMANLTSNTSEILTDEALNLLLEPVEEQALATQVSSVLRTRAHTLRLPQLSRTPAADWVAEGEEIDVSDAEFAEVTVTPAKLAGLSVVSNELISDSNPTASELIGAGLVRDITDKLDAAYFGPAPSGGDVRPGGLEAVGHTELQTAPINSWSSLAFVEHGLHLARVNGAQPSSWAVSPATFRDLAVIPDAEGSARSLLASDPTAPAARRLAGLPLLVSPAVEDNVIWAIDASQAFVVIREDVQLEADPSPYFSKDSTAVRAILRAGFGFSNPAGIVKIVGDLTE